MVRSTHQSGYLFHESFIGIEVGLAFVELGFQVFSQLWDSHADGAHTHLPMVAQRPSFDSRCGCLGQAHEIHGGNVFVCVDHSVGTQSSEFKC